jgi:hypothetical protein
MLPPAVAVVAAVAAVAVSHRNQPPVQLELQGRHLEERYYEHEC